MDFELSLLHDRYGGDELREILRAEKSTPNIKVKLFRIPSYCDLAVQALCLACTFVEEQKPTRQRWEKLNKELNKIKYNSREIAVRLEKQDSGESNSSSEFTLDVSKLNSFLAETKQQFRADPRINDQEYLVRTVLGALCSERAAKDDAPSAEEGSATPGGLRAVDDTAASTVRGSSVPPVGRALQEQQQSASSEPWVPLTIPAPQEQQQSASTDSSVSLTPPALRKQQQQSAPARSLSVADGQRPSFILESEEGMTAQSFLKLEQLIGARKDTLAVKLQLSNFKTISEEELKEVVKLASLVLEVFEEWRTELYNSPEDLENVSSSIVIKFGDSWNKYINIAKIDAENDTESNTFVIDLLCFQKLISRYQAEGAEVAGELVSDRRAGLRVFFSIYKVHQLAETSVNSLQKELQNAMRPVQNKDYSEEDGAVGGRQPSDNRNQSLKEPLILHFEDYIKKKERETGKPFEFDVKPKPRYSQERQEEWGHSERPDWEYNYRQNREESGPFRSENRPRYSGYEPKIPLPKFKESINVRDFIERFEERMSHFEPNRIKRLAYLEDCVKDSEAESWLRRYLLENSRSCNWSELIRDMKSSFTSDYDDVDARNRMEDRVKKPTETMRQYILEKLDLIARFDIRMKEIDKIRFIVDGLPLSVHDLRPLVFKTVRDLTSTLVNLEGANRRFAVHRKMEEVYTKYSQGDVNAVDEPRVQWEDMKQDVMYVVAALQDLKLIPTSKDRYRDQTPYRDIQETEGTQVTEDIRETEETQVTEDIQEKEATQVTEDTQMVNIQGIEEIPDNGNHDRETETQEMHIKETGATPETGIQETETTQIEGTPKTGATQRTETGAQAGIIQTRRQSGINDAEKKLVLYPRCAQKCSFNGVKFI
ncbi:hypothetical protein ONE63_003461 [Megalurothrips usitatus]|uniref:Uncharacterized protein n=1 Tax=Megalurothrips usitatus TaxID=439358 RepID=A0AAV7XDX6_9NEOP|nr:hypothetical protein ONE63_003461 [Megalurothrips usitatus]